MPRTLGETKRFRPTNFLSASKIFFEERLLDGYLDQDIDQEIYREEKPKLLSEKKTLEEQIINLEQKQIGWVAPMSEWIEKAENLEKIAQDSNLYLKKVAAKEIFGLHLLLANREAHPSGPSDSENSSPNQ